jgi:hypothetical protein
MEFKNAHVKAVKADIGSGELTISFRMAKNEQNMETADLLGTYVGKDGSMVEVDVIPVQPALPGLSAQVIDRETGEIQE